MYISRINHKNSAADLPLTGLASVAYRTFGKCSAASTETERYNPVTTQEAATCAIWSIYGIYQVALNEVQLNSSFIFCIVRLELVHVHGVVWQTQRNRLVMRSAILLRKPQHLRRQRSICRVWHLWGEGCHKPVEYQSCGRTGIVHLDSHGQVFPDCTTSR